MDNWVVVFELDIDTLSFEEFLKVFPVVHLLVKFETVVKLIHFYVVRVKSL